MATTAPKKSEPALIAEVLKNTLKEIQSPSKTTESKIIPIANNQTTKLERLQTLYKQIRYQFENYMLEQSISANAIKFGEMTPEQRFEKFLAAKNITSGEYEELTRAIAEEEENAKRAELTKNPFKHFRENRNLKLDPDMQVVEWRAKFNVTEEEFLEFEKQRAAFISEQKAEREQEEKLKFLNRATKVGNIIKSAGIPRIFSRARLTDFKVTERNRKVIECLKAIHQNQGFYIYGECGTGKTLLVSIIANERAENLKSSMFICATDIFKELNVFNNENQSTVMDKLHLIRNTPCLIIDDLGVETPTPFTKRTLFDIINYRYNEELQTIITSNFNLERLQERLSDYEGKRIIRRIRAICREIELTEA